MNPKRFFVEDKPKKPKSKIFKKDLFFKLDDTPGYFKDGYFFEVKSIFTGWDEEGEIHDEPINKNKDKNEKKIIKENSLFNEEITLRNKLIKKILFVPNFRLEETKKFFEKQNKVENQEEAKEDEKEEEKNTIFNFNEECQNNNINELNNNNDYEHIVNNSYQPFERIYNEIKVSDEELEQYKLKLEQAKKSNKNVFQLIKEIRKKNSKNNEDNKFKETNMKKMNIKPIKDIENNEVKLLTPNEQNELLMFFVPDDIDSNKDTICQSCKGKGHSKEQCMEFPDPDYDKPLKHCMNCGNYGHLYCRNGIKEDNENNMCYDSEEDDENYIYNHGKRYYFDFNLEEDKKRGVSISQGDEEEMYETGATNIINEDSKDDNMLNYLI